MKISTLWLWGRSDVTTLATLASLAVLVVMVVVAKLGGGPGSQGEKAEGDKLKQRRELNITSWNCHQQEGLTALIMMLSMWREKTD